MLLNSRVVIIMHKNTRLLRVFGFAHYHARSHPSQTLTQTTGDFLDAFRVSTARNRCI